MCLCGLFQLLQRFPLVVGGEAETACVIVNLHMTSDPNNLIIHDSVLLSLSYCDHSIASKKYNNQDFYSFGSKNTPFK